MDELKFTRVNSGDRLTSKTIQELINAVDTIHKNEANRQVITQYQQAGQVKASMQCNNSCDNCSNDVRFQCNNACIQCSNGCTQCSNGCSQCTNACSQCNQSNMYARWGRKVLPSNGSSRECTSDCSGSSQCRW